MGEYDLEDYGLEVEQIVQLELEEEQHQDAQLKYEVEQEIEEELHQDVQLVDEVEQEKNIPQQVDIVEGIAEGMVVVHEMPDAFGEQENVNPNIMGAPIAFVGISVQEGVALGVLQEQIVDIQKPPVVVPPQVHDQIIPLDNGNEGLEGEVEEVDEFEIEVLEVEVDGDGDVVMVDADVDEGVGIEEGVGQGVDVQEAQVGHL
eukprot:g3515.t1